VSKPHCTALNYISPRPTPHPTSLPLCTLDPPPPRLIISFPTSHLVDLHHTSVPFHSLHFTSLHFTSLHCHVPTPVLGNTRFPPYFKFPSIHFTSLSTFLTFSSYVPDFPALQFHSIHFTSLHCHVPTPVLGNTRFPPYFKFPSLHFTSLSTFLTFSSYVVCT